MIPLQDEAKVNLTAAVLVPPEEVWEPIQAVRRVHDPQFLRWMPHITMAFPFVPEARLAEAADLLRPAVGGMAQFEITLDGFGKFTHSERSVTLWVRPEPFALLAELQGRLQQAMPWCDDVARFFGGFTPHLSLGRFRSVEDAMRVADRLNWQPLRFRATEVALLARSGAPADPFRTVLTVPLATGG